ncbi:MAG: hypothetical protein IT445_06155 [Phycisphaeraceae bacterium]|nr:hypothetical protein [Phycisphaeraceae bacterium]
MTKFVTTLAGAAFCASLAASGALAVTISESFEYDDGLAIQGLGGGTGWAESSTWMHPQWTFGAGSNVVGSPSLTYPGVTSVGGKAVFSLATTSAYPMRLMGTSFSDGNTFYLGFLAQKTVADDNTRWMSVALLENVNLGVLDKAWIGSGTGMANFNAWLGGTTFVDSGVNTQNLTYILAKVELLSGTEKVTFWTNPDLSAGEYAGSAVGGTSHDTAADWGTIGAIRIGGSGPSGGRAGASHVLDELMVTTDSPFAHPGDANGDGMVNLADLQILGDNWQSTTANWAMADFTWDSTVNLADLQIIGDNWGYGTSPDLAFDEALSQVGIVIPEPVSLAMLVLASPLVLRRRIDR